MEPVSVETASDLAACLNALRLATGWAYTKIDTERKKRPIAGLLPRTTVNDFCRGAKSPTREQLLAFLRMCNRPDDAGRPFVEAWERVNDSGHGRPRHARRVRDCDPLLLGVHRSIRPADNAGGLPVYVRRDVDDVIRPSLRDGMANGGCFLLLVGDSSVGKTRTAFEALAAEAANWWLVNPRSNADLEAVAADPGRHTVVWLDEIQRALRTGLTAGIIRALLLADHPVLIMGTIWPAPYRRFRTPPTEDWEHDPYAPHREVLQLATTMRLSGEPSPAELERAHTAATTDRRLATAATSRYGLYRALAAVPALIDHWDNAPDTLSRTIVTAAVDAVRLGSQTPLSEDLLRHAVTDYLTEHERPKVTPDAWAKALAYAKTELDGAASMLEPIGSDLGVISSYLVADALVEHIGVARTAVVPPASAWEAYCNYVTTGTDLFELGIAAEQRMLLQYAERLYQASGTAHGFVALGFMLFRQDRGKEAVESWRNALQLDLTVLDHLVDELDTMGWPRIVEHLLRVASALGDSFAWHQLANRLDDRLQPEQADRLWREAADARLPGARTAYALRRCGPKSSGAEQIWRQALSNGEPHARSSLAQVLSELGRLDDVEQLWRDGVAEGEPDARDGLVDLLMQQDREDELEALWRAAIAAGEPGAWEKFALFRYEFQQPAKAEKAWRDAEAAGQPLDKRLLVEFLINQGRLDEAEKLLQELVQTGEAPANELAEVLEAQGRTDDVEALWQSRLANGSRDATGPLADLLKEQGRTEELEQLWRQHIDQIGGVDSLTRLLETQGRDDEVEHVLRQRTAAGDSVARILLVNRLAIEGRLDDAEQVYRSAIEADQAEHMELAGFLKKHGQFKEAERVFRAAVRRGENAAWWGLITVVKEMGRQEEAQSLQRQGLNADGSLALSADS